MATASVPASVMAALKSLVYEMRARTLARQGTKKPERGGSGLRAHQGLNLGPTDYESVALTN